MVIGIDIDGVLTNMVEYIDKVAKKWAKKRNIVICRKEPVKSTVDYLGWTEKEDQMFWDENIWDYSINCQMKRHCNKYLNKLHDEGNKIVVITKRKHTTDEGESGVKMQKIVLAWLYKNHIPFDDIFYVDEDANKSDFCLANKVDIFLEDNIGNIEDVSRFIPVICLASTFNESYTNENMYRCKTWKQVYKYIENFINTKEKE